MKNINLPLHQSNFCIKIQFLNMKKGLLFLMGLFSICAVNAATYYWVGGTAPSSGFQDRSNWSTVGVGGAAVGTSGTNITFTTSDILIIDGTDVSSTAGIQTGAISCTNPSSSAVVCGQFIVQNGGSFSVGVGGSANRSLTVGNTTSLSGNDLVVNTGCYLNVQEGGTSGFTLALLANNTGLINGTLEIGVPNPASNATSTFTINTSGSVTVNGTWVHSSAGAISTPVDRVVFGSSANFVYKGSSTCNSSVAMSGKTYPNLYFESTSGTWAPTLAGATATIINGNLFVGGSGAGNFNTGTGYSGDLTINGSVTVKASSTMAYAGNYTVKGNWTNNGTFTHASGKTVTFNGTTTQTVTKSGGESFRALTIANTSASVILANGATASGVTTINSNATLETAGTLTATGGATVNGKFQINQGGYATGTFTYAASGSTLAWNLTNASGVYYGGISAHSYWPSTNSPFNVSIVNSNAGGGVNIDNITRTITGTFTLAGKIINNCNLTYSGSIALNSNYEWGSSCGTFSYSCPSSNTLTYGSGGTVTRGPEWTSGLTPSNVVISNNTTINGPTAGAANICGDLTISSGSNLYMDYSGGSAALNVNGNFVQAGNLSLGSSVGGDMTVGGNWTHTTGTFNTNSRLVTFNGASGNQTITNAGGETFAYLTVNKASGDVVLGGNVTVNNTLALTTGNVSIAANTLTLGGAFSRTSGSLAGGNTSSIVINAAAGNLYFDNASTNNYLKALTIGASGSATLANALNITSYDGANEGVLTITSGGSLASAGFLTLKSGANGSARIAAGSTSGGYISGDVTVERYIPQNSSKSWRLLASTTTGQSINASWQEGNIGEGNYVATGFGTIITGRASTYGSLANAQTNGYDALAPGHALLKYDPATDNLYGIANTLSTGLASEQGYFIFIRGDRQTGTIDVGAPTAPTSATILRSKGTLFMGDQTAVPTGTSGYGLVRNPYPSRLYVGNIVRSGIANSYQVWDSKLGGGYGVGGYQTIYWGGSNYLITPGGGSYGANNSVHEYIESGAAFFIQGSAGSTAQVTEACKTSGSNTNSFRPAALSQNLLFNLYAVNPTSTDMVDGGVVLFDDAYSNAVDIEDIRKSPNFRQNFGLIRDNVSLAVEKRHSLSQADTVFFDMSNITQLPYRLDISTTNMDPLIIGAVLEDKYTNSSTALDLTTMNSYSFTADANAASRAADRFRIVFRTATVVPVTFVSVKAAQLGGNIAVEWKVANQLNIVKYEVEKSADGTNFTKVGTISASNSTTYNWLDQNVVRGYNYYRIKSLDNNGQVKYTEIVKVLAGNGKPAITVSPNPIQGNFVNIQFTEQQAGKYGIRLINVSGQVVYSREVFHNGGNASQSFALSSPPATGIYQLEITTPANVRHTEKLIVNPGN